MTSASTNSRTVRRMSRWTSVSPSVSVRRRMLSLFVQFIDECRRVRAEERSRHRGLGHTRLGQRDAGGEDLADAWLVDEADQRVGERVRVGGQFREGAIALPQ